MLLIYLQYGEASSLYLFYDLLCIVYGIRFDDCQCAFHCNCRGIWKQWGVLHLVLVCYHGNIIGVAKSLDMISIPEVLYDVTKDDRKYFTFLYHTHSL